MYSARALQKQMSATKEEDARTKKKKTLKVTWDEMSSKPTKTGGDLCFSDFRQ